MILKYNLHGECSELVHHSSKEAHLQAINGILRYLKSTPRKGILFEKDLSLEAYIDKD